MFNFKTNAVRAIPKPANAVSFEITKASDVAAVGVTNRAAWNPPQREELYRIDIASKQLQKLDSILPDQEGQPQEIIPVSVSDDGTVVAAFRPRGSSPWFMRQYPPGNAPARDVWIPDKYRAWLGSELFDVNENTLAIATTGSAGQPGGIAVLDIAKQTVIAERGATNVGKVSLADPQSLYFAQAPPDIYGRQTPGTMKYWRIGEGKPRVIYRGLLAAYKSTNCGNRALVSTTRRLWLIDSAGKVLLQRRVAKDRSINLIACSANYLHYLNVVVKSDDVFPFATHVIDISKLRAGASS
jgi:hypothetical protein